MSCRCRTFFCMMIILFKGHRNSSHYIVPGYCHVSTRRSFCKNNAELFSRCCQFLNRYIYPQGIFFLFVLKSTPDVCILIEDNGPMRCRRNGIQRIPALCQLFIFYSYITIDLYLGRFVSTKTPHLAILHQFTKNGSAFFCGRL